MAPQTVHGKTLEQWRREYPLLEKVVKCEEVFWENPRYGEKTEAEGVTWDGMLAAADRLRRFAPYIQAVFPETAEAGGLIESPLIDIPNMRERMAEVYHLRLRGKLLLKCDSHLPISGSIKARGGIYEVLKHAETLALQHGLLSPSDSYAVFNSDRFRRFFSQFRIVVGSTGNLGLSIGIMGAALGFRVTVHMSQDAKQWKKELLRSKGVTVIEHPSDYSQAVEEGRKQAAADPACYFIDDEHSRDLFYGYAVAALRLQEQLRGLGIAVDADHPLFVYLPCGVGGGPGGVTFGLKQVFGEHVHCFFAEPTHSPCFLIGLMTGLHDRVSVFDFGLDNQTAADGLAVGRPSGFVGKAVGHLISGCYTVSDDRLFAFLRDLADAENVYLEPSALAGCYGPVQLVCQPAGQHYLEQHHLIEKMDRACHIIWATGGSMVPNEVMEAYYHRAK